MRVIAVVVVVVVVLVIAWFYGFGYGMVLSFLIDYYSSDSLSLSPNNGLYIYV